MVVTCWPQIAARLAALVPWGPAPLGTHPCTVPAFFPPSATPTATCLLLILVGFWPLLLLNIHVILSTA